MKLVFIIDPISKLEPNHDSTIAMIEAAQESGHEVWIAEINKLSIYNAFQEMRESFIPADCQIHTS